MQKNTAIQVIVHYPETEEGRQELAQRVADVHADYVLAAICGLTCPDRQKRELLQGVIDTVRDSR